MPKKNVDQLKEREQGFNISNLGAVRLPSYNALYDPNMRHFFENEHTQRLLYGSGQIDKHGRVIDLEKNKSKLFILEKEFEAAEKIEEKRQKEELEMRYRVQKKRFNELERQKKLDVLNSLKAERELSNEIIATLRMSTGSNVFGSTKDRTGSSKNKKNSSVLSRSGEGFFITDK